METEHPKEKHKRELAWEDGYRAGSDLGAGKECPIPETDVEPFRAWREGWISGRSISAKVDRLHP